MSLPAENVRQIEGPVSHLPVQSETSAVLHMIERAARDPAVDIDKLPQDRGELPRGQAFDSAVARRSISFLKLLGSKGFAVFALTELLEGRWRCIRLV